MDHSLRTAPDFYIKTDENRTTPYRFDRDFSLEEEFHALVGMRSVFPDDGSNPIVKAISFENRRMTLEMIRGKTLAEMKEEGDPRVLETVKRVEAVVKVLHAQGWAHGDLRAENVLWSQEFGCMKLIDPVGYPQNFIHLQDAIQEDLINLKVLRRQARKPLNA